MILNRNLEVPKILHFPGASKEFIDEILQYVYDMVINVPDVEKLKYEIITCFTPDLDPNDLLLVKQLDHLNIPYTNAWDYVDEETKNKPWKYIHKLIAYRNYLLSEDRLSQEKIKRYSLILDARDTFVLSFDFPPPFKYYTSSKMLFNGGKSDYPNKYGKITIKSSYPVFLNSGACICDSEYAAGIFTRAIEEAEKSDNEIVKVDDQAILRELRQFEENHIKVDDECKMFQIINNTNDLIKLEGKLIVK